MKMAAGSNAFYTKQKSHVGTANTHTAKLETCQNNLCIQFIPKPSLMQQVKRVWGWLV